MKKLILTCKYASRSNMSGVYNGVIIDDETGKFEYLEYKQDELKSFKWSNKYFGFVVKGCGLNRFFELARALGFKTYNII